MKKVLLLISLLNIFFLKAGEKIVKGKISDSNNHPVAFANIGIVGTATGTVADYEGNFIIFLPVGLKQKDSLKISCIGYLSYAISADTLPEFLSVRLKEVSLRLPEVTVKANGLKKKVIGNKRENTYLNCNFAIGNKPNQNLGSEIGRKFFFKGKKHYINKMNLYCAYNFDTVLLRLNIYSLKNGLPDKNLLSENIIIKLIGRKRGWCEFDLQDYHLVYDVNIIAALEWIGHSKKGKALQLPITVPAPGAVHFYKFGSQDKWRRYNNMSTSINLEVEVGD